MNRKHEIPPDPSPLRDELDRVFAATERSTGLELCFRPLSSRWGRITPSRFRLHRSGFCEQVKNRKLEACMRWDHQRLYDDCPPGGGPIVRTCHAGADEVIVPVTEHGALLAVVFLGQFRRRDRQPRVLTMWDQPAIDHALAAALPLQSYLLDVLHRLDADRPAELDPREARIERFLRTNLRSDPSLADLADHLALSVSRTSHLVAELTGRSFRDLKQDHRLATAIDLLTQTDAKIAAVAAQCGFPDPNYFCRYVKQKTGLTPTAHRDRRRRPEPPV